MPYNKIDYYGDTKIDLSGDTVIASKLLTGTTAHDASGNAIVGTMPPGGDINPQTKAVTPRTTSISVTPDTAQGYNALSKVTVNAVPYSRETNSTGGCTVNIGGSEVTSTQQGNSKIIYYGQKILDLTADTVTAADLLIGKTAHDASGSAIVGTNPGFTQISGTIGRMQTATYINGQTITESTPTGNPAPLTVNAGSYIIATWDALKNLQYSGADILTLESGKGLFYNLQNGFSIATEEQVITTTVKYQISLGSISVQQGTISGIPYGHNWEIAYFDMATYAKINNVETLKNTSTKTITSTYDSGVANHQFIFTSEHESSLPQGSACVFKSYSTMAIGTTITYSALPLSTVRGYGDMPAYLTRIGEVTDRAVGDIDIIFNGTNFIAYIYKAS